MVQLEKFSGLSYFVTTLVQCTEVDFAILLSGGFTTMAVLNQPEMKLTKRTSVQCKKRYYQDSRFILVLVRKAIMGIQFPL